MVEAYNNTLVYRIGFAVIFFSTLAVIDWRKHPNNPTRIWEYLFLIFAMAIAVVYGLIHDQLTATISPEYFLVAKGLANDPRPFRLAVSLMAVKAAYGPGVLTGAVMLIANNPSPNKPQLSYDQLRRICVYPVGVAAICACLVGFLAAIWGSQTWLADVARASVLDARISPFLVVSGIHAGSYLGATLGTVVATYLIIHRRKKYTVQ